MPDPPDEARTKDFSARAAKARIERHYTPFLKGAIEVLNEACTGADAILSTPHQIATAVVGTQRRIPWVTLTVFPGLIPSAYSVPEPHWLPALPTPPGSVGESPHGACRFGLRYLGQDAIAAAVASLGIPANKLFAPGGLSPHLCLVMSSPVYSPPQPDWPPQVKVTGFVQWDEPRGYREPPELTQFLSAGPAPVVVTTSTAEERDTVGYARVALRAIEATGRRGILLTGASTDKILGAQTHLILDSGVAAWPYIPLSRLLPRASMVVHHSGIGTAITTIRHGLGAVAIPASFDQWYNATRVRALWVGRIDQVQRPDRRAPLEGHRRGRQRPPVCDRAPGSSRSGWWARMASDGPATRSRRSWAGLKRPSPAGAPTYGLRPLAAGRRAPPNELRRYRSMIRTHSARSNEYTNTSQKRPPA